MKMPIRWSDEGGDATPLERDVLGSDRGMDPTASQQALVWAKLAGELGLASVGTAAVAATASKSVVAKASTTLVFLKGVVVGVAACGAVWGGSQLLSQPAPTPRVASPVVSAVVIAPNAPNAKAATPQILQIPPEEPPPPPSSAPTGIQRAPSVSASSAASAAITDPLPSPSVAQFGDGEPSLSAQERESQLKAEALLLRQARERLRAGQLASAQQALEESRSRFANPTLYQEREALTIELLFRSGQTTAAAERARMFLKAFPGSPHASRIKTFTSP